MTEQWMPGNKQELLSAIEREWKLLLDLAESLTDEQMSTPDSGGWSPKDNLAHIAEWMNNLMGYHMDKRPSHEVVNVPEEVTKDWDADTINKVLFERNKNRPRGEVMELLKQTYVKLVAKLKSTGFEALMEPRYEDDPGKTPLLAWVLGNTTEHFQEHRETIEREFKRS
jgi:hypothetical protein